ncbi:phytoene synthase [Oryzisolibacter propanilivorax]|uniref:Phytoene synthase n=1 Tax=Oryzisolibacter propanilivorax TaxID=1527607 RepID=A0A1G9QLQ2_9BURK|nr:phytoene/squalene synthase family protein [Oryzisolibacter propanilivorax]SDM11751.1 phytoene synthase [Oryzisolibacter propanilivorax]
MTDAIQHHATEAIRQGSQSFAAAARLLEPAARAGTVRLYAWCRHCDDVIDGQQLGHGGRQQGVDKDDLQAGLARIAALRDLTRRACAGEPVAHPAFAGLQQAVRAHGIPLQLLEEHLAGFAMDVDPATRYERIEDTLHYAWRVAGVVGVMMALVMGTKEGARVPPEVLDRACDLGVAFQLTNIARDVADDARAGRVYLPAQWLREAGLPVDDPQALLLPRHRAALAGVAARLVALAEPYYRSSLAGIGALPLRSAWSIATARGVYREIGRRVQALGPAAWDTRVATSRADKLRFIARGGALALLSRTWLPPVSAPLSSWQAPARPCAG